MTQTEQIKAIAREAGFGLVGVASAAPPEHWAAYQAWIGRGFAGEMDYLSRSPERRADPTAVLPGARSVLCVGAFYHPGDTQAPDTDGPAGQVSCYALGDDYHDVLTPRLHGVLEQVVKSWPGAEGKVYVDTGPVLERDFAMAAGLGWFGKHTNLIDKWGGSYFFLGEILLTMYRRVPDRRHRGPLRTGFEKVYIVSYDRTEGCDSPESS